MIRGKYFTSLDRPAEVLDLRRRVFVEEQGYPADTEADSFDDMAMYALVYDESDAPAGTARMVVDGNGRFVIGKVCTLPEKRGKYLGDLLMRMLLYRAQDMHTPCVYLSTPLDCVAFFARYGFKPYGELVEENGVPHRLMRALESEIDIEGTCGGKGKCAGCQSDCAACGEGVKA